MDYPEKHASDLEAESYEYHTPLSVYDKAAAPTANDDTADGYAPGSRWVDTTNDIAYVCLDATAGAALWLQLIDGADYLDKATYDAGDDGLIDTDAGGTGIDSSAASGIAHVFAGLWSVIPRISPGADTELTIAAGAVTVTQFYHRIDTQGDDPSDDLDTINGLANDGELLLIHPENDARTVVVKHGTGNIYVPGGSDITLDDYEFHILLVYDAESTSWCVIGAGGGGGALALDDLTDVNAPAPNDGDVLTYDDGSGEWVAAAPTGGSGSGSAASDPVFHVAGALSVATDQNGVWIAPRSAMIQYVYIYCRTPGSAGSTIVDVNKNGTSIFATTQANRPTLAYDDADQVAKSGAPDTTALVENDVLSIDIDQVGTDAEDLTVIVALQVTPTDATDITYTPAVDTDWDSDTDPGDVDDALDQLAERVDDLEAGGPAGTDVGALAYHNTNQSIANGKVVTLALNSEVYDTDTIHDPATNNSRLTCKTEGKYIIGANVEFESNATGHRILAINYNGSTRIAQASQNGVSGLSTRMAVSTERNLAVNDYVEVIVYQNSGGSLNAIYSAAYSPYFWMRKVG
jgi:hypothetical protein